MLRITKTDGATLQIAADTWRYDNCGFLTFSGKNEIVLSIRPEFVLSIEPITPVIVPEGADMRPGTINPIAA